MEEYRPMQVTLTRREKKIMILLMFDPCRWNIRLIMDGSTGEYLNILSNLYVYCTLSIFSFLVEELKFRDFLCFHYQLGL